MPTTPNIAPLDQQFEMPAEQARAIWESGVPLYNYESNQPRNPKRIRLGLNAEGAPVWVVRLTRYHDVEHASSTAKREFGRLQQLGLHVISFASTPISQRRLATVTPLINDIETIDIAAYNRHIKPVLAAYYTEVASRPQPVEPYIHPDIIALEQHSRLLQSDVPFLHDVDPLLIRDPVIARFTAEHLAN